MSDLAISHDEEMVGAGHPTKSDTLNRLFLSGGARTASGKVNRLTLAAQSAAPATVAGETAIYAMTAGGELALFLRRPNNGASLRLA